MFFFQKAVVLQQIMDSTMSCEDDRNAMTTINDSDFTVVDSTMSDEDDDNAMTTGHDRDLAANFTGYQYYLCFFKLSEREVSRRCSWLQIAYPCVCEECGHKTLTQTRNVLASNAIIKTLGASIHLV